VKRALLHVALGAGQWSRAVTPALVRDQLAHALGNRLGSVEFYTPADNETLVEAEVVVFSRDAHCELARDTVIEALLKRLKPEYDSMVEVEVLDD